MVRHQVWVLTAIGLVQGAAVAFLFAATSPLQALFLAIAIPLAIAIFLRPHLGVYAIAALLIGQWPWNAMRYLGIITVLSAMVKVLLSHRQIFSFNPVLTSVGLYTVFALASAIDPQTRVGIWSGVITQIAFLSWVWLFVTLVKSRRSVLTVAWIMVFSGIVTAVVGLIQWQTHFVWITSTTPYDLIVHAEHYEGKEAFDLQQWSGQFRIDSITGTPDFLPLYMQSLMPLVAFWTFRQTPWIRRFAGLLILAIFLFAHLLSYTRGAILTTALVLILSGWFIDKRRMVIYTPLLLLLCTAVLLTSAPWRERLITMSSFHEEESPDRMHTGTWRWRTAFVGLKMMYDHPFTGVGISQQRWNWPKEEVGRIIPSIREPPPIHNTYLRVGIELGLAGLAAFLLMLFSALRHLRFLAFRFRLAKDFELADLSLALFIALIGIASAMFLYPMEDTFRYFWLFLGLAASLTEIDREKGVQARPRDL